MRVLFPSLLAALLSVTLLASPVRAQPTEPVGRAVVSVAPGSRVNVRATPEVRSGNIVGKAVGGQEVEILGSERRGRYVWYRVRDPAGGFTGWIRGDLLRLLPVVEPPPAEPPAAEAPAPAGPSDRPEARERRPAFDWSRDLPTMMPAIRGCAAASSARPVVVLIARRLSFGVVDIVLRDAARRVWRCVSSDRGGIPIRYDPLGDAQVELLGTPNPEFYLESDPPPADACHELEVARDPETGEEYGVLRYNVCP